MCPIFRLLRASLLIFSLTSLSSSSSVMSLTSASSTAARIDASNSSSLSPTASSALLRFFAFLAVGSIICSCNFRSRLISSAPDCTTSGASSSSSSSSLLSSATSTLLSVFFPRITLPFRSFLAGTAAALPIPSSSPSSASSLSSSLSSKVLRFLVLTVSLLIDSCNSFFPTAVFFPRLPVVFPLILMSKQQVNYSASMSPLTLNKIG